MNEQDKVYTVAELVDVVGVPRTTINDWLVRYNKYIDFEIRGKRKVYFGTSVNILNEILQLRNSGKSSYEIENALQANHPLRPEVFNDSTSFVDENDDDESSADNTSNGGENTLPQLRNYADELRKNLSLDFENLCNKLEMADKQSDVLMKSVRKMYLPMFLIFILMIVGVIGILWFGLGGFQQLRSMQIQQQNTQSVLQDEVLNKLQQNQQQIQKTIQDGELRLLNEQQQKLQNMLLTFEKNSTLSQAELTSMRQELQEQRILFTSELNRSRTELIEQKDAEIKKIVAEYKKNLNAQQLKINELNSALQSAAAEKNKLQTAATDYIAQINALKKNVADLNAQISDIEKSKSDLTRKMQILQDELVKAPAVPAAAPEPVGTTQPAAVQN